jgi:hypothetical protein
MLTLVNNLSDISFCDKQCSNVNNNEFKSTLLKHIDEKFEINVIDRLYNFIRPNMVNNVLYHQHVLATLTNGNPYLLYLTKIDGVNCCFYIDRKLKDGYEYPKIHCVKYRFADELFNDTILSGELVRDSQRRWFFLLADILLYKGAPTKNKNIVSKFELMNDILLNHYTPDKGIEVCPIYVKKLFMYKDFQHLVKNFIPNLSYTCRGIVFYTLNSKFSNYSYQIPRDEAIRIKSQDEIDEIVQKQYSELWGKSNVISSNQEENIQVESTDTNTNDDTLGENNVVFQILKTEISDIFNLYCSDNKELTKYGIALVPTMKISKMMNKIFMENKNNLDIRFKCRYSEIFDKWVPVCQTQHKIYLKSKVEKIHNKLNREYQMSKI